MKKPATIIAPAAIVAGVAAAAAYALVSRQPRRRCYSDRIVLITGGSRGIAKMPVIAASVNHAAGKIYNAVAAGRAEITITPQAWLAARAAGLAPGATQYIASVANHYVLPKPAPTSRPPIDFTLKVATRTINEIAE